MGFDEKKLNDSMDFKYTINLPYKAISNNATTIMPKQIDLYPLDIANVESAIIETIIHDINIILYTVFLSFILSDIVEYPILPSALNDAVSDGIIDTIVPRIANPAKATVMICFS